MSPPMAAFRVMLFCVGLFPALASGQQPRSAATKRSSSILDENARLRAENDSLRALLKADRSLAKPAPRTYPADTILIPDAPTEDHPGTIRVEFDRFRNYTAVSLDPLRVGHFSLSAYYTYPGTTPMVSPVVSMTFHSPGTSWSYLRCHNIDMLVDGSPFLLSNTKHDGSVGSGIVVESVTFELTIAELLSLIRAKTVDGQLCKTEFKILAPAQRALQDLVSRMKGPSINTSDRPHSAGEVEMMAVYIPGSAEPRYPNTLRRSRLEGEVLAEFVVDTTGIPELATFRALQSSHAAFTDAVREALPSMRFFPAEVGGRKVKQTVRRHFTFRAPR